MFDLNPAIPGCIPDGPPGKLFLSSTKLAEVELHIHPRAKIIDCTMCTVELIGLPANKYANLVLNKV